MESQWLEIVSWAALALGVTGTYGFEMVADAHARARGRLTRLESRRDRFFERRGVVLFRIATSSTDWPPTSCRMRSGTTSPAAGSRSQLMPGRDALFSLSPTRAVPIPPDDVQCLFRPFQRLSSRRATPGVGLGLAIVQAIADAHNAAVTARARSGGGLRIEVAFPPGALSA